MRIEVDSGRIDFKRGPDKLPFALINVNGVVEQDGPGRWSLDLESRPMRAAVIVQEAGTIHVRGHIGGTSSRMRPADLELNWPDASLSDILRLARNQDYGIRGRLSLNLQAHSDGPDWNFSGGCCGLLDSGRPAAEREIDSGHAAKRQFGSHSGMKCTIPGEEVIEIDATR